MSKIRSVLDVGFSLIQDGNEYPMAVGSEVELVIAGPCGEDVTVSGIVAGCEIGAARTLNTFGRIYDGVPTYRCGTDTMANIKNVADHYEVEKILVDVSAEDAENPEYKVIAVDKIVAINGTYVTPDGEVVTPVATVEALTEAISAGGTVSMSENIDARDDQFYLYHIKEKIFSTADLYCKTCSKKGTPHCLDCQVPICKDKLGSLSFRQLHDFLRITNPHISGTLSIKTFAEYSASPGINNPFFAGLRDIPQVFLQDQSTIAVTYHDFEKLQYALTAIAPKGTDDDNAIICSEIVRNRNVYSLLMDYDCLISKDISVDSIQDEEITQSHRYDPAMSDHIAHCKNVRIVPLTAFEASLSHEEENGNQ